MQSMEEQNKETNNKKHPRHCTHLFQLFLFFSNKRQVNQIFIYTDKINSSKNRNGNKLKIGEKNDRYLHLEKGKWKQNEIVRLCQRAKKWEKKRQFQEKITFFLANTKRKSGVAARRAAAATGSARRRGPASAASRRSMTSSPPTPPPPPPPPPTATPRPASRVACGTSASVGWSRAPRPHLSEYLFEYLFEHLSEYLFEYLSEGLWRGAPPPPPPPDEYLWRRRRRLGERLLVRGRRRAPAKSTSTSAPCTFAWRRRRSTNQRAPRFLIVAVAVTAVVVANSRRLFNGHHTKIQ